MLLSIMAVPIYIPINSVQKFCFLHTHCKHLSLAFFLYNSYPNRYEVISHCGFDLHFLDD